MLDQLLLDEKEEKSVKDEFINALVSASKQVSKDEERKVLHYVHVYTIQDDEKGFNWLNINSTDSHRAFYYRVAINKKYSFDELISTDNIKAFKQGKTDKLETIKNSSLVSEYPNMIRVLPHEEDLEIQSKFKVCQLLPMLKGLKSTLRALHAKNEAINLDIDQLSGKVEKDGFTSADITITVPQPYLLHINIPAQVKPLRNKCFAIDFNIDYLINALQCFNKNEVVYIKCFNNIRRPFEIVKDNKICLICPVVPTYY